MQSVRKSGAPMGGDCMETPTIFYCSSPYCAMNLERCSQSFSASEVYEDILSITPRLSHHNPNIYLERRLHNWNSLSIPEMASSHGSNNSMASTEFSLQKPAAELIEEIASIELQVEYLERHLLSLYRTAFNQYVSSSPIATTSVSWSSSECVTKSIGHDSSIQREHHSVHLVDSGRIDDGKNQSRSLQRTEKKRTINHKHIEHSSVHDSAAGSDNSCGPSPREHPNHDVVPSMPCSRSLADHLGASIADHVPETACKLSEDIIRCISAIYCKLAKSPTLQMDIITSPTSSTSSSSTFSPQNPCDSWSPQCHYEGAASPCQSDSLKDRLSPYSCMIEVPQITVDGDRFGYASKMLNIFRSLIRRLETTNPRKLEHEEQLAFWINIHNALVMHAFLAYGLHQNHMKNTFSILKAAYDIGGHSINASVIQSSILGCQLHRPAVGIRALFLPAKKLMKGNNKHPYAIDRPEPLAHFALCLGAYSDPAVRVYTAKGIYQELKLAKEEFIEANIRIQKETKLILPKILQYYARDASLELPDIVEMVRECTSGAQQKAIQGCLGRKPEKCVGWSPYKSSFRYLVHRDLAK